MSLLVLTRRGREFRPLLTYTMAKALFCRLIPSVLLVASGPNLARPRPCRSALPQEALSCVETHFAAARAMGVAASLPDDVLDKAACWLDRDDLLYQRTASPSARDAAQRAIAKKANPHVLKISFGFGTGGLDSIGVGNAPREMRAPSQSVVAMGNVFGAGCVELDAAGVSAQSVAALRSFVNATNSGLRKLSLYASGVSPADLVAMCQAAPNLLELSGPIYVETPHEAIVAIAAACPRLEQVKFSTLGSELGPAERWARFFPRLRTLALTTPSLGPNLYRPTHLDAIRETALVSQATELDVEGCHVTTDLIAALVGTPLADRIETIGDRYMRTTNIEPDAMLAAARGFPNLAELWIPEGSVMGGPGFYVDLSRATNLTRLTSLHICDVETSDECVATACEHLQLHDLELVGLGRLTSSGIVNGITRSRSAKTLGYLVISRSAQGPDSPLRAVDVLRIFQGCPELGVFNWYCDEGNRQYAVLDDEPVKAIIELP